MSAPDNSGFLHELLYQHRGSSRVALVSPQDGLELSYAELCRHSSALAARLRERTAVRRQRIVLLLPGADPEEDALFILTSGTTGHPKAVRLSHRAIRRNIDMHLESLALEGEIISLQVLPVNYSYGLNACLLSTLRLHGTTVLTPHV